MKIRNPFKRSNETTFTTYPTSDVLMSLLGINAITQANAMRIPSVSASVGLISDIVSSLRVKLYRRKGNTIEEVQDKRTRLINDDTLDTFDGVQFKKALVKDYLLSGNCYVYINRNGNEIVSLHYIDPDRVSFDFSPDPIFKNYQPRIDGVGYSKYDVMGITRNTTDGYQGINTVAENSSILSAAFNTVLMQDSMSKSGGAKPGFLTSEKPLTKEAMEQLKSDFRNMYGNQNEKRVIVLNSGMDFKESSSTAQELQMNENKKTNNLEINSIFRVPYNILYGNANDDDYEQLTKNCISPILAAFEAAFNKFLLLESEKDSYYFAFDTTTVFKGNMMNRFNAYGVAIDKGIMQIDEVRIKENMNPLGMDLIRLGLQDVLYNPKTHEVFTPNTGMKVNIEKMEGGETNASD